MKIIHIASGDLWAGAEAQLYGLATTLARDPSLAVRVVLLNHGLLERRLRAAGVAVSVFDERRLGVLRIGRALVRLLRAERADVVHTHRTKENVLGSVAARLAGVPCGVRTVHGAEEHPPRLWQARKRLYRALDRLSGVLLQDRVVAVSADLAARLGRRFPRRRLATVENGVDLDGLYAAAGAPVELPYPGTLLRVAFVGRLVPVKRIDLLLLVARRLLARGVDARFHVLGDGPLARDLEQGIAAAGLGERVLPLGFRDDVPAWLARMDALLVLSDHEGLPGNVLEALALGVPVIAHAVGGIPAALGEGRFGTLVPDQDPERYAQTLAAHAHDSGPLRRKAQAGVAYAWERYGMHRVAEEYRQVYWGVVGRRFKLRGGSVAESVCGKS